MPEPVDCDGMYVHTLNFYSTRKSKRRCGQYVCMREKSTTVDWTQVSGRRPDTPRDTSVQIGVQDCDTCVPRKLEERARMRYWFFREKEGSGASCCSWNLGDSGFWSAGVSLAEGRGQMER